MAEHVDVGGIRLAYQVFGDANSAPLVLLHGLGDSAAGWSEVATKLADHRRVYALDLRGHGESEHTPEYSYELMRDDVIGFLDALGVDSATLVGHSTGGLVALLVAEEVPRRVERLVVEDAPLPYPRQRDVPDRPADPIDYDWAAVAPLLAQVANPDPRWRERLTEVTAPTLVIAGGPTSHMPQEWVLELAERLPHGRAVTIAVGHEVHRTDPQGFLTAVLTFLTP
ncbi:alpha/beta hydrolase [Actinokineospora sp. NBRC 105648]|uniref:alpha/beta fold hydrolase n=1 Tax=Actinokineospora sp. NBRC 105648 TaxID=3032206 RepID=UPI0024A52135|nr:alpha/beta hydrolase [Actinokineospora sp. NBRC 105648]GLZ42405.1 alpha/beta hydrolase [Actinokineospora sp. NBRC 105648]